VHEHEDHPTHNNNNNNNNNNNKSSARDVRESAHASARADTETVPVLPPTIASPRVPQPSTREKVLHPGIVDLDERAKELDNSGLQVRAGYGAGGMSARDIDMRPYPSLNRAPDVLVESLERADLAHEVQRLRRQLDEHRRQAAARESPEARMTWLEGQVRRLRQQLDSKGKALAASDAAVSSLENKVQRLQRQLRQAEVHASRAEGVVSSREHDHEALELESELLRMEEALRVSKSAALRSSKEAERERAARVVVEQDLQAITMSAPAEVPAKLLERIAHIEAELARERRARTDAETQVSSITASMVGEIEEMSATRSGALAELRSASVSWSL
jgi:hypothetical protein